LRVVRRFGAAGAASGDASPVAAADFAVVLRVARGFAAGASVVAADVPSAAPGAAADFDAVVRRARGLAAGASETVASTATGPASSATVAFDALVERPAAGLRVERVAVGAAAASATSVTSRAGSGARLGAGFWETWARSIASSSGGTSLHGSFEVARGADGAGWRLAGRSSRL
jgi:hypothetical protein